MSEQSIPKEWSTSKLSDAIAMDGIISDGDWIESKDQDPNGDVRLIQLADVGDGDFRNKSQRFMTPESAERLNCTYLEKGDILIARMPDPLGRACLFPGIGQKAVTVVDVCLVRAGENSAFINTFLKYWINTPDIRNLIEANASGTTRKRITRKKLEAFEYPLPPLAEQREIARRLDELLAQVDTLKTRLDAIPAILKRFRQSTLAAATSGKLTEQWRGGTALEKAKVGDIAPLVTKGASPKWQGISYVDDASQTLFVTSENVGTMTLLLDKKKYVQDEFNEKQKRSVLELGDVLTNIVGASIGRATVWDRADKANTNQAVCIVRLDKMKCLPEFLSYYLNSPVGIDALLGNKVDVARANVSLSAVKELEIPLPSLEEQTEIVRRVTELFAFADQVEQRVNDAQACVNHLTQSILAKAFRGELTADWRAAHPELISGENSAEALLKRIKTERANLTPKKKTRGKK
jgi:type I restriction enzyme S subunit